MKVKMRTPNELFFYEYTIDPNDFVADKIFDDEVFGQYRHVYVSLDRESYDRILVKKHNLNED